MPSGSGSSNRLNEDVEGHRDEVECPTRWPRLIPLEVSEMPGSLLEALIHIGTEEVPYVRTGQGPPVLVLAAGGRDHPDVPALLAFLSPRYRIWVPGPARASAGAPLGEAIPTSDPTHAAALRLRGVIDGLGLDRPALVALDTEIPTALHFARVDPGRVGRLALLHRAPSRLDLPALESLAALLDEPPRDGR